MRRGTGEQVIDTNYSHDDPALTSATRREPCDPADSDALAAKTSTGDGAAEREMQLRGGAERAS